MNTPELTLNEVITQTREMIHDVKMLTKARAISETTRDLYCGILESNLRLLSLARIQIESQGVTRKSEGPSSTLPASSDAGGADADPSVSEGDAEFLRDIASRLEHGGWDRIFQKRLKWIADKVSGIAAAPPIHTEESPSDSELLTDGDVERLEDLQKALKAEGYRNSLSHEMGVLIPRILPVLRSVIKAAMEQEKR
jgi:hypothetical protein